MYRFDKKEQAGINLRVKLGLYLKAEISKTDANNRKLIKYDNFNIIYANLLTYQRIGCVIFDLDCFSIVSRNDNFLERNG